MTRKPVALVLHGGAGVVPRPMEPSLHAEFVAALSTAVRVGRDALLAGAQAVDVVEKVVRVLEDEPLFNAGRGAVFTHDGKHELDAAVMDGRSLACGAVAAVSTVRNPISAARAVMEKTKHVLLVGAGADQFASTAGLEIVDNAYFSTERRRKQWLEVRAREGDGPLSTIIDGGTRGTVGCVALDAHGDLAAATSTGGLANKRFGRVGDSPVVGAGTYANNATCAVSCTGTGEEFIRHVVANGVHQRMALLGEPLGKAADGAMSALKKGDGGLIAVSSTGEVAMPFNSEGMYRAVLHADGRMQVGIWDGFLDVT